MQTLDLILAVGETKTFDIGGAYFELIDGGGPVDVNFTNAAGSRAKDLEMLAAVPGYWVSGPFSRFEVKNVYGYAQTVRVMFGAGVGGSRRIQGQVAIADKIGLASTTVTSVQNTLGFQVATLVLPTANVRGLLITLSIIQTNPGAGGQAAGSVIAGPVAPAGVSPSGYVGAILQYALNNSPGVVQMDAARDSRKLIPAGWGLYHAVNGYIAAAVNNAAICTYELL